jgi:transketolase
VGAAQHDGHGGERCQGDGAADELHVRLAAPDYIRLAKGGDSVVSRDENGFAIGKAIPMRRARSRRSVALLSTGVMTTSCLGAADLLAKDGIDVSVVHFHMLMPE